MINYPRPLVVKNFLLQVAAQQTTTLMTMAMAVATFQGQHFDDVADKVCNTCTKSTDKWGTSSSRSNERKNIAKGRNSENKNVDSNSPCAALYPPALLSHMKMLLPLLPCTSATAPSFAVRAGLFLHPFSALVSSATLDYFSCNIRGFCAMQQPTANVAYLYFMAY